MEIIEEIERQANELASHFNYKVLARVLIDRELENKYGFKPEFHAGKSNIELINSNCRCSYCKALRQYVNKKIEAHRFKKFILDDRYPITNEELNKLWDELAKLEMEFSRYKRIKDRIKSELKIN